MAKTMRMGKSKVEVEKSEGPLGDSVRVPGAKGKPGKVQRVEIEVADNGGFMVTIFHKERERKGDGLGGYVPPKKHAVSGLDELDDLLDDTFGISD